MAPGFQAQRSPVLGMKDGAALADQGLRRRGVMVWRLALIVVTVPMLLYCLVVGGLYFVQGSLLFRPMDLAPDAAAAGVPGLRTVRVRTADGLDLVAWFLPPPPGRPTVLYLHGNGGSIGDRIARVKRIARRGWGLMMLEYRGYGGNPGTPSETGLAMDGLGALDGLAALGVPSGRLVLYGESLGTGVAVRLATARPVAAVVLDAPYTSVADVAQLQYWFLPAWLLVSNPFDILARISRVNAPLLVMQGDHDTVIPPAMGRAVFEAAREPKEVWVSAGGLHGNVMETGGEEVMATFLARYVAGG